MRETEEQARLIANRYSDMLPEPAWRLNIWENLGWHISWRHGCVSLYYEERDNRFWAMVCYPGHHGGHMDLQPDGKHFRDPLVAVRHAAEQAQAAYREKWMPIIASVEVILQEFS